MERLSLPDLSYMLTVGELRYIQATFESGEYRSPDSSVGTFLPLAKRMRAALRAMALRSKLHTNPFYAYVLARTKYYDEVFVDAIYRGCGRIINVGCGSDTRAYRFAHLLKQKGVTVAECDQEEAISAKQRIARRTWPTDHVEFLPIDLNADSWRSFEALLEKSRQSPTLVMLEGVSLYVGEEAFGRFLRLLADRIAPQSVVAYDFKILGVADRFGASSPGQRMFRIPVDEQSVADFHAMHGFKVVHLESSSDLTRRIGAPGSPIFAEDGLVRLVRKDIDESR